MKHRKKPLAIGGVLRCCAETLDTTSDLEEKEGDVLPCRWCKGSLIVRDGVWRWNQEEVKVKC